MNPTPSDGAGGDGVGRLSVEMSNLYKCHIAWIGDGDVPIRQDIYQMPPLASEGSLLSKAGGSVVPQEFTAFAFERERRERRLEAQCVIPAAPETAHGALEFVRSVARNVIDGTPGPAALGWGDDWLYCWSDGSSTITCDGAECTAAMSIVDPAPETIALAETIYNCSNGCYVSSAGYYDCPGGGGGGGVTTDGGGRWRREWGEQHGYFRRRRQLPRLRIERSGQYRDSSDRFGSAVHPVS